MNDDLQKLAQRIAEIEAHSSRHSPLATRHYPTAWEEILLGGKLAAGSLVELLAAEEGAGAWTLALFMARRACGEHKVLVVVDAERRFYPPAASQLSIDLRRTIVIRPQPGQPALAALTQSLRCAAVGAALGKLERVSTTDCRRLQVAAENGGGVGFLLRSAAALNMPSFASLRLLLTPMHNMRDEGRGARGERDHLRRLQVEVVRFRGSLAYDGGLTPRRAPMILEIDDEKGHVHIPAAVAVAKSVAPPA